MEYNKVLNDSSNVLKKDKLITKKYSILMEIAGILHDIKKFNDDFINKQIKDNYNSSKKQQNSDQLLKQLQNINIEKTNLVDIINNVKKLDEINNLSDPEQLCVIAHSEAHIEKADCSQCDKSKDELFISSPFGYEYEPKVTISNGLIINLEKNILPEIQNYIKKYEDINTNIDYKTLMKCFRENFQKMVADTRRPHNEITLWSWGYITGSMMKAAYAAYIFGNTTIDLKSSSQKGKIIEHEIKWRFLRIHFDGTYFIFSSEKISDIIARKNLLDKTLDEVKKYLEYDFPIGNEIYRDENGSVFLVGSNFKLKYKGKSIEEIIKNDIRIIFDNYFKGELVPIIEFSKEGQFIDDSISQIKLYDELKKDKRHKIDFEMINTEWKKIDTICSVCGLRPIGSGNTSKQSNKAKMRNVCSICEKRREDRSLEWLGVKNKKKNKKKNKNETIWIDETSDENNRCALIVGRFDLTNWLNGEYIKSIQFRNNECVLKSKESTLSILYRIWNTTKKFWNDVLNDIISNNDEYSFERKKIKIKKSNMNLGNGHVYTLKIGDKIFSAVWYDNSNEKGFVTASNKYDIDFKENKHKLIVYEKINGQLVKKTEIDDYEIDPLNKINTPYIKILTEPSHFMVIVPAKIALKLTNNIREKFELEMGKIRNRMPFYLGIIYFHRMQPIRSILNAGLRIITQKSKIEEWTIEDIRKSNNLNNPDCEIRKRFGKYAEDAQLKKYVKIMFKKDNVCKTYYIPKLMKSPTRAHFYGNAEDVWYIKYKKVNNNIKRKKKTKNNYIDISLLNINDKVELEPNKFVYIFLDNGSKRFKLGNIKNYLELEEIYNIKKLWDKITDLVKNETISKAKLHQIIEDLYTKKEIFEPDVFENYSKSVIANEGLNIDLEDITSGRLFNAYEIFHYINKEEL